MPEKDTYRRFEIHSRCRGNALALGLVQMSTVPVSSLPLWGRASVTCGHRGRPLVSIPVTVPGPRGSGRPYSVRGYHQTPAKHDEPRHLKAVREVF